MSDPSKLWTPVPPSAYTVLLDNVAVGVGMLPWWGLVPGAWNILAMTYPDLPQLLSWAGPAEEFPANLYVVPFCIGMALQLDENFQAIGEVTESTSPQEFLNYIEPIKDQLILPRVFGETWWGVAQKFAEQYHPVQMGNTYSLQAWKAKRHAAA